MTHLLCGAIFNDQFTAECTSERILSISQYPITYFTFRMPCSILLSNQWLLHLVVDVAASDANELCDRTLLQQVLNCLWLLAAVVAGRRHSLLKD